MSDQQAARDGATERNLISECRSEDARPRIFTYDERRSRWWLWGWRIVWGYMLVAPFLMWATKSTATWFGPHWQGTLALPLLEEALIILLVIGSLAQIRSHADALTRCNERIVVDADGVTFEDGFRQVAAPWSEIRTWKVGSRREGLASRCLYILETEAGTFEFTPCLQEVRTLIEIITLYLGRDLDTGPDTNSLDPIEGADTDKHLYTYRTHSNRAALFMPLGIACALLVLLVWTRNMHSPMTLNTWLVLSGMDAGYLTWGLIAWMRYQVERLETDSQGIAEWGLLGQRKLNWQDVRSFTMHRGSMFCYGEVRGTTGVVRFRLNIGHIDQLKAEIAQQAVHSSNQGWN